MHSGTAQKISKNVVQYGGTVAAPIVKEILEQSLTYLKINRDYENQIENVQRFRPVNGCMEELKDRHALQNS